MNEHPRRRVPEVLGRRRGLHPGALLRARSAAAPSSSSTCPTTTWPSLRRGGHDYRKVYAAYKAATEYTRRPDGHPRPHDQGLDPRARASRPATSPTRPRSCPRQELRVFRDRLELPIPDAKLKDAPVLPSRARIPRRSSTSASGAAQLGGSLPKRVVRAKPLPAPSRPRSTPSSPPAARPPVSTTMVFARLLRNLIRDPRARAARSCRSSPTRRARSAWTRCSRRSASTPPTASATSRSTRSCVRQLPRGDQDGQVLEEGITEAGSMASFQAAGTAYATHGVADDPVLHLLLDVRLPADRRPDLGLRRRPRPRLHAWARRPAGRR